MNRTILLSWLAVTGSLSSWAAPVANITTSQPFTMNGHSVAFEGVTSWPVVLGDDVTTWTAPAILSFPDGSTVKLAPRARAKLSGTTNAPKLNLLAGALDYKLAAHSSLVLTTGDKDPNDTNNEANSDSGKKRKHGAAAPGSISGKRSAWIYGSLATVALVGAGLGIAAVSAEGNASNP